MVNTLMRRLAGAAGLAALCGTVTVAAGPAAEPALPPATAAKAIDADTAHLTKLFDLSKSKKKLDGRIRATAMVIATYAQNGMTGPDAAKMAAVRNQALKVAEAVTKKDMAAAKAAADGLKDVKADGSADTKPLKLAGMHKLDISDVMHLFGGSAAGGMNLEKDIQSIAKGGAKDPAAAELIGARAAALADLYIELKPAFDAKKTEKDWNAWSAEAKKEAVDLATEAAKGAKADKGKLKGFAAKLDATCTNCHNTFRE